MDFIEGDRLVKGKRYNLRSRPTTHSYLEASSDENGEWIYVGGDRQPSQGKTKVCECDDPDFDSASPLCRNCKGRYKPKPDPLAEAVRELGELGDFPNIQWNEKYIFIILNRFGEEIISHYLERTSDLAADLERAIKETLKR